MGISHITIKRHIARALLAIMEHGEMDENGFANRTSDRIAPRRIRVQAALWVTDLHGPNRDASAPKQE